MESIACFRQIFVQILLNFFFIFQRVRQLKTKRDEATESFKAGNLQVELLESRENKNQRTSSTEPLQKQPMPNHSLYNVKWLNEQFSDKEIPIYKITNVGKTTVKFNRSKTVQQKLHVARIIKLLKSARSSEDLQSDLFDNLGFDHIDLIQNILQHRSDILKSL